MLERLTGDYKVTGPIPLWVRLLDVLSSKKFAVKIYYILSRANQAITDNKRLRNTAELDLVNPK